MIPLELRDALFSVIRFGLEQGSSDVQLSPHLCDELMKIGTRQAILPILYNGLRRINIPDEIKRDFDRARLEIFIMLYYVDMH